MNIVIASKPLNLQIIQEDSEMGVRPLCHVSANISINSARGELSCDRCGKLIDGFTASRTWATSWGFGGHVSQKTWSALEETINEWAAAWLNLPREDVEVKVIA